MAMVNNMVNVGVGGMGTIVANNVKDSRWLTLEVCREFQRNKCTRPDTECKFAHPPPHVEVQNGRVTACFDSIKGKCQRKDPPCKYLHPPQHLREQLLQNGRNNLILKNLQMQAALQPVLTYPGIPPQYVGQPMAPTSAVPFNPYSVGVCPIPTSAAGADGAVVSQQIPSVIPNPITTLASQQKLQRADRLEVCREFQRGTCSRQPNECRYAHPPENVTVDTTDNLVTVCMDYVKGKCTRDSCKYFHPPPHLQAQIKAAQQRANTAAVQTQALPQVVEVIQGKKRPRDPTDDLVLQNSVPGMIPYKRVAVDAKSPLPVYQQPVNIAAYQQAIAAMQGQQYIPMTYSKASPTIQNGTQIYQPTLSTMQLQQAPVTITGHPPGVPRF